MSNNRDVAGAEFMILGLVVQMLFGRSFQLEVRSELGPGTTTVTMRIPLQTRLEVVARSLKTMAPAVTPLKQRHS